MLDSIAAIQARIGAIQTRFTAAGAAPASGASSTAPATTTGVDSSFEAQLTAALGEGDVSSALASATSGTAAAGSLGTVPGLSSTLALPSNPGTFAMPAGAGAGGPSVTVLLEQALAQTGDSYVFGASTSPTDPNPGAFDCSELVKWAAGRNGVQLPDGSWNQYLSAKQAGLELSVEQALRTPGALLYRFESDPAAGGRPRGAHVAISLGDGRTIEARGRKWGVGTWSAEGRFTHASLIPGFSY